MLLDNFVAIYNPTRNIKYVAIHRTEKRDAAINRIPTATEDWPKSRRQIFSGGSLGQPSSIRSGRVDKVINDMNWLNNGPSPL
jgi:hypothetical protein